MHLVLAMLEGTEENHGIHLKSPAVGDITDKNSGKDSKGGLYVNNLCGNQLKALGKLRRNNECGQDEELYSETDQIVKAGKKREQKVTIK